jgi:hypothetical protein
MLLENPKDSYDSFSDLLADLADFDSPSATSGIRSQSNSLPATNEPGDKFEQPSISDGWGDDALNSDNPDRDRISRLDGERDGGKSGIAQIRISGAHESDTVPHTPVNGQVNKLVRCPSFFFLAHIFTDRLEAAHQFSVSRQWSWTF